MALKFEIGGDEFESLGEGQKELYSKHGEKYRLQVDGIDPADELKEALRKEREERAEAKRKLQEFEQQQQEAERKRMEERQEYEQLYKSESEKSAKIAQDYEQLKRQIADKERAETALSITGQLTRDTMRAELLKKESLQFIHHTPEGVKINGPEGEAWDTARLTEYLKERYPFLVDGPQATGAGAAGGSASGAGKKPSDYTEAERVQLFRESPDKFRQLFG